MARRRIMKPEELFEYHLKRSAPLFGCQYIKIKDTRSINKSNRGDKFHAPTHREVKRICDAIIVTKSDNWFCECKINYEKLLPHQENLRVVVNDYNKKFVVLRKVFLTRKVVYRIEVNNKQWETEDLDEIFKFLSSFNPLKEKK